MVLTISCRKKLPKVVTSQFRPACLTDHCEIFDHKAAFLLVKNSHTQKFNLHTWKRCTGTIDLSYNIEDFKL